MPTHEQVQAWLDDYVAAWRSYDPAAIRALFADDVAYRFHPYAEPVRGAGAVAEAWLAEQDEPDSWEARYEPALISGDHAIATGETRYADGQVYSNLWQLEFGADGRCTSFTEWWARHPQD